MLGGYASTKQKTAIVTGANGQDGFYMTEFLAEKGYRVIGTVRKLANNTDICRDIEVREIDLRHYNEVYDLIQQEKPDEIYNFAAQSSSIGSWDNTRETCELNFMVPVSILESIRDNASNCRFFQASSAEVFGKDPEDYPQTESTTNNPLTPYATAKSATGMIIRNYRDRYGIYAVNGFFYNHESIRRKIDFIPAKITKSVAMIKKGRLDYLAVGNIDSQRDWGYAPDYMEAAWMTMQCDKGDDYVFATGILHTVREMINESFACAGIILSWSGEGVDEVAMDRDTGKIVVRIDKQFFRSYDRCRSLGNADKLKNATGWSPKVSFSKMIEIMTDHYLEEV